MRGMAYFDFMEAVKDRSCINQDCSSAFALSGRRDCRASLAPGAKRYTKVLGGQVAPEDKADRIEKYAKQAIAGLPIG